MANIGIGALEAAGNAKIKAIGAEVDQYFAVPENVRWYLLTSAVKNTDKGVEQVIREFIDKNLKVGIRQVKMAENGVGLASYHEWEERIDWPCKQKVEKARQELTAGVISVDVEKVSN